MDVLQAAGGVAAVAAGAAGTAYLVRGGWRASKTVHRLAADLLGDEEAKRPGVVKRLDGIDTRLGEFDARLAVVEGQVTPNGGKSLHDKVSRVAAAVTGEEGP